jgi:hypothetical protein
MSANANWALRHSIGVTIGFLVVASVALTFGYACAVPLAAFGAISALLFDRTHAVVSVLSVWAANQVIGFCYMNYPVEFSTLAWGAGLGVIGVASTFAAAAVLSRVASLSGLALSLIAAFAVYQGAIIGIIAATGGDLSLFTLNTLSYVFAINAISFVAFAGCRAVWLRTSFGRTFAASLMPRHA